MKRNILCTLAVMAACAILVACGKTDDQISPITPESNAASSEAEATPEPTPTLPPYEANVLTGEAKGENYPEGQRITALMVNNLVDARPQRGLSKAQMLFEIKVEGGITRFMPVFNDYHDIDEIGPIRSGRDQFFQLILPWQALYIHEGQSVVMQQYALDYDYGLLNNNDGASGYRDYNRVNWRGLSYGNGLALEHTMYTSGENIEKYITNNNVDMNRTYNSTFFNFVDYRQDNPVRDLTQSQDSQLTTKDGPVVKDGEYVEISHSQSYKTRFLYDNTNNVYLMQQNFSGNWRDTIDEEYNDYQLQFPNVIVLFTDIHTYPGHEAKDLQYVEYSWGGIGYYFYGGKCEKIYWQKGTPLEALRLYYLDENGQCSDTPCEINIGKSYVTIVDVDEAINLKVGNLADFDLDAATVSASNTSIDADAKAGESLGLPPPTWSAQRATTRLWATPKAIPRAPPRAAPPPIPAMTARAWSLPPSRTTPRSRIPPTRAAQMTPPAMTAVRISPGQTERDAGAPRSCTSPLKPPYRKKACPHAFFARKVFQASAHVCRLEWLLEFFSTV